MKKLALIFTGVLIIGIVCFGVSFAIIDGGRFADSTYNENGGVVDVSSIDYQTFTSEDSFSEIEIGVTEAKTTIMLSGNDTTTVQYRTTRKSSVYTCEVIDNRLVISESIPFSFGFFNFFWSTRSELIVSVPAKTYNNIKLNSVSGGMTADGLLAQTMNISTVSGDTDFLVFADDLTINTTSGKMNVTNCTGNTSNSVRLSTTSGNQKLSGFRPDNFSVSSISGKVELMGISGRGKVSLTSGDIDIDYAEWNDDLDVSLISGEAEIKLPYGSGAKVDFDAISGNVKSKLEDNDVKIDKNSVTTIGGANVHNVKVNLTSGRVVFEND